MRETYDDVDERRDFHSAPSSVHRTTLSRASHRSGQNTPLQHLQNTFAVTCSTCSRIVEVVNPRLRETPVDVHSTEFGLYFSDRVKIVRTRCPKCGHQVWAKFHYA